MNGIMGDDNLSADQLPPQRLALLVQMLSQAPQYQQQVSQPGLLGEVDVNPQEQAFQGWIRNTDWFKEYVREYGEEPDLNIPEYDYRAAWRAGITPQRDPYDRNRYHWPSSLPSGEMLKSKEHPTAWKEMFMRETGKNPDAIGITTEEEADAILRGLR